MKIFFYLLISGLLPLYAQQTVSILYFTDAHQIMPLSDEYGNRGGMSRLKTIVDEIKTENPNSFLIFGGDLAGGTLFGGIYKGHPMIRAMNMLPVDIANFGQHEFDFGIENARTLVDSSNFQWITANIGSDVNNRLFNLPPYIIINTGSMDIAFFGLTDALETTSSDMHNLQLDIIKAAEYTGEKIIAEDPDFIVAVTQMNRDKNKELLLSYPWIDAVLTEEVAEDETHIFYVGGRPVCSSAGNISSLLRLDIADDKCISISVHPIDSTVANDSTLQMLEQYYIDEMNSTLSTELAVTNAPLPNRSASPSGLALGNLIADAYRDYYQCDAALMHTGGLRAPIDSGTITVKDVHSVLPFGNFIVPVSMDGATLKAYLEHGAADLDNKAPRLLQVSGISCSINTGNKTGERITHLTIGGKAFEPEEIYRIALPDYLVSGGDDFPALPIADNTKTALDVDIVKDFLRKQRPIKAGTDGRITIIDGN